MAVATFDTLKFANVLKAAGVPDKQAEAQAVAFADVIQLNLRDLVTKDDLAREIGDLRRDLKHEMKDMGRRLDAKIDALAADVKAGFAQMRSELSAAVSDMKSTAVQLRGEQATSFAQLRGEQFLIRSLLGITVSGVVAILIRLFLFRGAV